MNLARLRWLWTFLLVAFAFVVGQRLVAGVFEFVSQQTDRLVEDFVLMSC